MADEDLKKRLESLLFSAGRKLEIEELAKHCNEENIHTIKETLKELQKELDDKKSSLMLIEEGTAWKLTVREQYVQYVKKVVKQAELPKSMLETLSVVAFKAPAMQSQIIKIRTNKAYKHLEELEEDGYITREKKGRTKLIKLTQKFYNYFDLPPEKLKEKFKNVAKLEKAIEEKEQQIEKTEEERKEKIETYNTLERVEGKVEQPVEIIKEQVGNLEVYETTPKEEESKEKIGNLEVYEREQKKKKKKEEIVEKKEPEKQIEDKPEEILESKPEWAPEQKEEIVEKKEQPPSKGIFPTGTPPDVEKKIDEIVKEMTEPKEDKEENQ